ncbi:double-strand break repair protein MRE11 [Anopheles moucheti]|uniref:double-strand break repair protein MRE11 n=1 Tax=Anopheles moucheti TaxID=186751 RepID=UPI0022F05B1E|nr:double-strand break repair protein MRE11 [Anopheles moucheti]
MSESTSQTAQINPDDTIKILVASDIHLGFKEKDRIRGDDSFIAFEEVLQHALENEVDAILLGGDLFDVANPSTATLDRCFRLLKTYLLGDKPIKLEFMSAQNVNFVDSLTQTVNYEDPNINIAIPMFSIHGNHDDSGGSGRVSSMHLLSTNGYVNYFGKWTDLSRIDIRPILLRKGETKLALYGLSYMSDARLCRLLEEAKVFMERPDEPGFFNVMVLHQNRVERGPKNHLPESSLPQFLDLIIWGHEHDCRIEPEENSAKKFYVSQPGSTVATSLSEGEAIPKCCGLLSIHKGLFRMDPIPLQSVRPFVFESVDLATVQEELALDEGDVQQKVKDFAAERIEAMIERAQTQLTGYPRQPKLPLIRLRLILTEVEQQFNAIRFGMRYVNRVANPLDMVIFKKKPKVKVKNEAGDTVDKAALKEAYSKGSVLRVEDIVESYFLKADPVNQLEVLHPRSMTEMMRRIVHYEDDDVPAKGLKFYLDKALAFLPTHGGTTKESALEAFDEAGFHTVESKLHDQFLNMLDAQPVREDVTDLLNRFRDRDGIDEPVKQGDKTAPAKPAPAKPARGRGSRGGRGASGRAASKAASATGATRTHSQASISAMFSQKSDSNSSIASVATRTSSRKTATQKARQMDFDSDPDE